MGRWTRRAWMVGGAAALTSTARAEGQAGWTLPPDAAQNPAFGQWNRAPRLRALPLDVPIVSDSGQPTTLRRWLGNSPTILTIWATWCAPCLRESPDLAALSERLERAGAALKVRAIQAFDDAPFRDARRTLDRLNADALISARATRAAEQAFVRIFGASQSGNDRIAIPALLFVAPDGSEIGRLQGLIETSEGSFAYWRSEETFDFLMSFGRA